jgi:hypothetical protein
VFKSFNAVATTLSFSSIVVSIDSNLFRIVFIKSASYPIASANSFKVSKASEASPTIKSLSC